MILCCYDVDLSDKYQEIYFFSYVISLFLLMIFVFDLTNPYWYKYLIEKNVTWISTNYHLKKIHVIMSCEKSNFSYAKHLFLFIFYWLLHDIYLNGNDFSNCMIYELSHDDHVILIHMIMYNMCVRIVSCLVPCPSVKIHIQI